MPASTLTTFDDFSEQLGKAVHDFTTHTFKLALTNSAPVATNTILANITQIASGGGYTNGAGGGYTVVSPTWVESSGVTTFSFTDHVITATAGAIATFRYIVLYNDSASSPADALIGWLDYGSALTLADTETLTIDLTTGIFTVTA